MQGVTRRDPRREVEDDYLDGGQLSPHRKHPPPPPPPPYQEVDYWTKARQLRRTLQKRSQLHPRPSQ